MKVVIFCGGLGMRLREYADNLPKPMVPVGRWPILRNVMRYYAHYGHSDFILCLGWKGEAIRDYFLREGAAGPSCVRERGDVQVRLQRGDMKGWQITFAETGVASSIGERLQAVACHLRGEATFLANYADGLSDLPLPALLDFHYRQGATATFVAIKPHQSFHTVHLDASGRVETIRPIAESGLWMNGGYFAFEQAVFEHLLPGEDLVGAPLDRLISRGELHAFTYSGFWSSMDTYKDKQLLEEMCERGERPWEVWARGPARGPQALDAVH